MGVKKPSTFTIDESVKQSFKVECTLNDAEMSETVEFMMKEYIKASKELRAQQNEG